MQPSDVLVQVRNKALSIVGTIASEDLRLTLHDMYANVGTWTLLLDAEHPLADNLSTPGAGIVVSVRGNVIASGPVDAPSLTQTSSDPLGTLTFTGVTDTQIIADALAFPDPANSAGSQTSAVDYRRNNCESLMHGFVRDNIGPNAIAARKNTKLVMGTNGDRGKTVTRKPRFTNLGSLVAGLAQQGGLGFRVRQIDGDLVFQTYDAVDRTDTVVLTVADDSLTSATLDTSPPLATNVIVGGVGQGKHRQFRDVSTTDSNAAGDAWGRRIEVYMDYRGADNTPEASDLIEAGQERLEVDGVEQETFKIVPSEYGDATYGTAWHLGDKITVMTGSTAHHVKATGFVLKVDENGARMGLTLGDPIFEADGRAGRGEKRSRSGGNNPGADIYERVARLEQHTPDLPDTTWDNITNGTFGGTGVLLVENGTTDAAIAVMAPPVGTIIFEKAA